MIREFLTEVSSEQGIKGGEECAAKLPGGKCLEKRFEQEGVCLAGLAGPCPSHVQTQACVLGSTPHCPFPLEPRAWESLVSLLKELEFRAIPEAESW